MTTTDTAEVTIAAGEPSLAEVPQWFQDRVREVALWAQSTEGWCDSGFNEAMRQLGLPEKRVFNIPIKLVQNIQREIVVKIPTTNEALASALSEAGASAVDSEAVVRLSGQVPVARLLQVEVRDRLTEEEARERAVDLNFLRDNVGYSDVESAELYEGHQEGEPYIAGEAIEGHNDYNNLNWCNAQSTTGYFCTVDRTTDPEHDQHIATSSGFVRDAWPNPLHELGTQRSRSRW